MQSLPSFGRLSLSLFFFFFNDTATTEIYTLSLHDALPSCCASSTSGSSRSASSGCSRPSAAPARSSRPSRSEEHTSELQSRGHLVCRLLLEKKKKNILLHQSKKKKKTK